jgi:hypothetical protein
MYNSVMHRIGWCKTPNRKKIMNIVISNTITNATSLEQVIDAINGAATGHIEGMEGLEFTPAQLAGQYACYAAIDSGCGATEENIEGQLEFIGGEGAKFNHRQALDHAMAIAAAEAADDKE